MSRKLEQERIAKENIKMVKKIMHVEPDYKTAKFKKQFKRNQEYCHAVSKFHRIEHGAISLKDSNSQTKFPAIP